MCHNKRYPLPRHSTRHSWLGYNTSQLDSHGGSPRASGRSTHRAMLGMCRGGVDGEGAQCLGRAGALSRYVRLIVCFALVWFLTIYCAGYGPSEMTNVCTVCPSIEAWQSPRNVGPPLKNTSVFLASEDDQFCMAPRGAVGELCFAGDQVVSCTVLSHILTSADSPGARIP